MRFIRGVYPYGLVHLISHCASTVGVISSCFQTKEETNRISLSAPEVVKPAVVLMENKKKCVIPQGLTS